MDTDETQIEASAWVRVFSASWNKCVIRGSLVLLLGILTLSASGAPKPDAQPIRGGTLRVAMRSDIRSLDPAIAYDSDSIPVTRLLFRGLLEYDDGVNLVPG